MSQAITKLKQARSLMLIKHGFWATLMMGMPMIERTDIPTAATDMEKLYVNPTFIESLSTKLIMFVIAHEVCHVAMQHGIRLGSRNPVRWNVACDYAINLMLKDAGFEVWEHALIDERFRDPDTKFAMGADRIYNILDKEEQEQKEKRQGQGQPGQGDPQSGQGGQDNGNGPPPPPGAGQSQPGQGSPYGPGGAHHSPMLGDLIKPEGVVDDVSEEKLRRTIQQKVAQAANVARMTGTMTGDLERFVNSIIDPRVPWYEQLRHFMHERIDDEESWERRNRRFSVILPTNHSERMGEIIGIGDTSGSIGDEEIMQMVAEFRAIAEEVNPERIRMVWCDSSVKGEQLFEAGEEIEARPKGGGGTDMRVALRHVEQYEPAVVVLFTDGYTPWCSEAPDFPLIVVCTTSVEVPDIGEVIRYNG